MSSARERREWVIAFPLCPILGLALVVAVVVVVGVVVVAIVVVVVAAAVVVLFGDGYDIGPYEYACWLGKCLAVHVPSPPVTYAI